MPSSTRARRPIGRGFQTTPVAMVRPQQAPFAAAFGALVAAEDLYVGWLLWNIDRTWGWYLLAPVVLAVLALVGAALVWRGRWPGAGLLALSAVLPLIGLLLLAFLFTALGGGSAALVAGLMLVGPLGALVLGLQRPVRRWTARRRRG